MWYDTCFFCRDCSYSRTNSKVVRNCDFLAHCFYLTDFQFDNYDVIDKKKPVEMNMGDYDDIRNTFDNDFGKCLNS